MFTHLLRCATLLLISGASFSTSTGIANSVSMSYELQPKAASAGEPINVVFTIDNPLPADVTVDLGLQGTRNFEISVVAPDGARRTLRPPLREGFTPEGRIVMKPNTSYSGALLLSEWFDFSSPGIYGIEVSFAGLPKDPQIQIAASSARKQFTLYVTSRDKDSLRQTCSTLLQNIEHAPTYAEAEIAAKQLASIRDPIVVPFLQEATLFWHLESITIPSLANIGDSATTALIPFLHSEEPDRRNLARSALERIASKTNDVRLRDKIIKLLFPTN